MSKKQHKFRHVDNTVPAIKGRDLKTSDVGRMVIFEYAHGEKVLGKLLGWKDKTAKVQWIFPGMRSPSKDSCSLMQLHWA